MNEVVPWSQPQDGQEDQTMQQEDLTQYQQWEEERLMKGKRKSIDDTGAWTEQQWNDAAAEVRCELLMMS